MSGVEATALAAAQEPSGWREVCIATALGYTRVLALVTETPGLVVHTPIEGRDGAQWVVTHERSGYAVARFTDQDHALEFCALAREIADWTRARSALPRTRSFRDAVRHAARICGAIWPRSTAATEESR